MKIRLQLGLYLLFGLLGLQRCTAQTVTPNLGMTLPAQNAPNWGVTLNNNFSIIDTFAGTTKINWPPAGNLVVSQSSNTPTGLPEVDGLCAVGVAGAWSTGACGASVNFSSIIGGTNTTAAMVVGTGASLAATGSGTITATAVPAAGITGTTLASGVVTLR